MPYCTRRDYIYIPAGGRAFKSIGYSASPLAGPSPLTVTFDIFAFCYEDSNDAPTGFCIDYGDGKTETGVFLETTPGLSIPILPPAPSVPMLLSP